MEICIPWEAVQAASSACELAPRWGAAYLTLARAQLNLGERHVLHLSEASLPGQQRLLGCNAGEPDLALRSAETALELCAEPAEMEEILNETTHIEQIILQHHVALLGPSLVQHTADRSVMQRDALYS